MLTNSDGTLRLPPILVERIDEWRCRQPTKLSRSAAVRYLLDSRLDQLAPQPRYTTDMPIMEP